MATASPTRSTLLGLPVGVKAFGLLALLTVIFGLYFGLFQLKLDSALSSARSRHASLAQELAAQTQRQQDYLKLRETLAGREALERQILRILPEEAEIPAFLDDLNRLAELSGLRMGNVVPQPEQKEDLYVKLPVLLKIEGKYHQLAKFFYNISRLERAINMENITLGSPDEVGDEVVLAVDVLATTFRRRDPEAQP